MADPDDLRSTIIAAMGEQDDSPIDSGTTPPEPSPASPPTQDLAVPGPTPAAPPSPQRDAQGRFIPKTALADPAVQAASAAQAAARAAAAQPSPPAGQPPAGQARAPGPPPGWSVAGKAAYDQLPDAVKADIAKREQEVAAGFARLTEYKGLEPFMQLAQQQGTSLPDALQRYVEAEDLLDRDPVNGLLWLCQRYQVHPAYLVQAISGTQPSTAAPSEMGAHQNGAAGGYQSPPELAGIVGYLQALNNRVSLFEQQQSAALDNSIASEIDSFSQDPAHRFFPDVRHEMGELIRLADSKGQEMSLQEAYDKACWSHPEIRAHFIQDEFNKRNSVTQQRTDKVRRSSASLSPGSPVPGGTLTSQEPANSLREEIERAYYGQQI